MVEGITAHAVHAPQAVVAEESKTYDPDRAPDGAEEGEDEGGRFWAFTTERPVHAISQCPDCGRHLIGSTGDKPFTVCPQASGDVAPCHDSCVVACGLTE